MDEGNELQEMMNAEVEGKRARRRPRKTGKRWKDNIKKNLEELRISEEDALDRGKQRQIFGLPTMYNRKRQRRRRLMFSVRIRGDYFKDSLEFEEEMDIPQ